MTIRHRLIEAGGDEERTEHARLEAEKARYNWTPDHLEAFPPEMVRHAMDTLDAMSQKALPERRARALKVGCELCGRARKVLSYVLRRRARSCPYRPSCPLTCPNASRRLSR